MTKDNEIYERVWAEYSNGILGVSIYVKDRPHIQNARKFLWSLPKRLSKHGKIELMSTAYIMTFPVTPKRGKKGTPIGVLTQYHVEDTTLEFYKTLFEALEEKKKAVSWLESYNVATLKVFHSLDELINQIELEVSSRESLIEVALHEERIRQYEHLLAELKEEDKEWELKNTSKIPSSG